MKKTPFAMFVSSVEGHLVARYGTAGPTNGNELIGARKLPGGGVEWRTNEIAALTESELAQFGREYRRAIQEGALVERTEAEYLAFHEAAEAKQREVLAQMAAKAVTEE